MPVGNFEGDLHDFRITANGTALIIIYKIEAADLTPLGGPEMGYIYDGIFQEVDITTGSLLFEWHISHHVPYTTSYMPPRKTGRESTSAFDAYHINSIDKDHAGNYLLSSRHTHSVMSIDGQTGDVLWTLGGQLNNFTDVSEGHATDFAWQHDARWHDDHSLTLFDNTAQGFLDDPTHSRGVIIDVDVPNRVASLRAAYSHPEGLRAISQGNMQVLPESGNVFIGWGHCAAFTEFAANGEGFCAIPILAHQSGSNWGRCIRIGSKSLRG